MRIWDCKNIIYHFELSETVRTDAPQGAHQLKTLSLKEAIPWGFLVFGLYLKGDIDFLEPGRR